MAACGLVGVSRKASVCLANCGKHFLHFGTEFLYFETEFLYFETEFLCFETQFLYSEIICILIRSFPAISINKNVQNFLFWETMPQRPYLRTLLLSTINYISFGLHVHEDRTSSPSSNSIGTPSAYWSSRQFSKTASQPGSYKSSKQASSCRISPILRRSSGNERRRTRSL